MGSPYSKFPGGLEASYDAAVLARGKLLLAGVPCFSPIVNSHPIAMRCGIDPRDHAIWLPDDAPFMEAARGMIVAMMEGWQESFGVQEEIKFFLNAGKPSITGPRTRPQTYLPAPMTWPNEKTKGPGTLCGGTRPRF